LLGLLVRLATEQHGGEVAVDGDRRLRVALQLLLDQPDPLLLLASLQGRFGGSESLDRHEFILSAQ